MTEKITNYKALVWVLNNCKNLPENVKDKVQAMAFQQAQKAESAKKRQTARSKENGVLQVEMLHFLQEHRGDVFTCMELMKNIPTFANFHGQKISNLGNALVDDGVVQKTKKDKLVAFYVEKVEVEA